MNHLSRRLAARGGIRNVETVLRADAAADAVERVVHRFWRDVRRLIAAKPHAWELHQRLGELAKRLYPEIRAAASGSLNTIAAWGHRTAVADLGRTLPRDVLRVAGALRGGHHATDRTNYAPTRSYLGPLRLPGTGPGRLFTPESRALHDLDCDSPNRAGRHSVRPCDSSCGDSAELLEDEARPLTFGFYDLLAPFREPPDAEEPTIPDTLQDLLAFVFPSPPRDFIDRIVYAGDWQQRLQAGARLAEPSLLASLIGSGFAAGKSQQEIARDILPHVEGVRASARRVARTEGMRIAGRVQMQAHEQLGDLKIGYQVRALLDQFTRSWHASRNGTVYYDDPKPGQKGPRQRPNPPEEPEDPAERPAGTPRIAWNCRCWLSPILKPLSAIADDPIFTTANGALVPDPTIYSDWFRDTDLQRRRLAVGARRYQAVADTMGSKPSWAHFLDPDDGDLMHVDALKAETDIQRRERVAKVNAKLAQLRGQVRDVGRFGFVVG